MTTVAIVDCGMGNLHSVVAGVRRAQPDSRLTIADSAAAIECADKIIFPGDGNFGACMNEIDARGLRAPLLAALKEKPFFGICVGMQVLFAASEEADSAGLGYFDATIRRLPRQKGNKVPHMGWNTTHQLTAHPLLPEDGNQYGSQYYYFIHSYYAPTGPWTLMTCEHGVTFSAVIGAKQLIATQFHPEKSGRFGITLLKNFLAS